MEEKKYYLPVEKVDYLKAHIATLKEQNRSDHESNEFDSYNWRNEGRYKAYEEVLQWVIEGSLTPGLPPLPEPILTDKDVKDWEGEKDEQYVKATDTVTITMTNMNHPLANKGATWVRASEFNFIENTEYFYKYEYLNKAFKGVAKYEDGMLFSSKTTVLPTGYSELFILDESGTAAPEWDSIRLIGRVKERFKELEEKQHDWRSFYCAWLEGRVDMLQQIKGRGRLYELSQARADLIREANNRDLEGVASEREEDAVAFAEWVRLNWMPSQNGWVDANGKWGPTQGIYKLFKQQKEK